MQRNRLLPIAAIAVAVASVAIAIRLLIALFNNPLVISNNLAGETQTPAEPVREGEIIEPLRLRSGTFVEGSQPVEGTAQIVEAADGNFYLELSPDFRVPTEGDAEVLLAPEAVLPVSYTGTVLERYLNLGALIAPEGVQRYLLPEGTVIDAFDSVLILNPVTATALGYAPLDLTEAEIIEPIEAVTVIEPIETAEVAEPAAIEEPTDVAEAAAEPVEAAQVPQDVPDAPTPDAPAPAAPAPRALW